MHVRGGDERTVRSNLNNFMNCGIINRVRPKVQDEIEQAAKGLNLRSIDQILGGPIEMKFGKK